MASTIFRGQGRLSTLFEILAKSVTLFLWCRKCHWFSSSSLLKKKRIYILAFWWNKEHRGKVLREWGHRTFTGLTNIFLQSLSFIDLHNLTTICGSTLWGYVGQLFGGQLFGGQLNKILLFPLETSNTWWLTTKQASCLTSFLEISMAVSCPQ